MSADKTIFGAVFIGTPTADKGVMMFSFVVYSSLILGQPIKKASRAPAEPGILIDKPYRNEMSEKTNDKKAKKKARGRKTAVPVFQSLLFWVILAAVASTAYVATQKFPLSYEFTVTVTDTPPAVAPAPKLNIAAYNAKLDELAHVPDPVVLAVSTSTASTSADTLSASATASPTASDTVSTTPAVKRLWPVSTVYPNYGAILPFNRIVAYYGNFYTGDLGVLGQYPPQVMLQKLLAVAATWQAADPATPVIPALDYIAVTAQGSPGTGWSLQSPHAGRPN